MAVHKLWISGVVATIALAASLQAASPGTKNGASAPGHRVAPDNSGINKRDQSVLEPTADQQSTETRDAEVTRLIRQSLVQDDSLSIYAQNVKIITSHGQVTLKGPVRSPEEKQKIGELAMQVAGEKWVFNDLQIAAE